MHFSREAIEAAQTPEQLQAILSAAGSSPRWTVATLTEVAEFFGTATSTTKGWRMESPPMPGSDGSWPLDAITRWRHAKIVGSDLAKEKKEAELENLRLQNDQRRLELAKERGELLDRGDVERWASVACSEAREQLMQLPEMLATSSPPDQRDFIRAETDRHVRDTLAALRRRLESDELDKQTTAGSVADDDSEPSNETESDQ
jgi:hypothetical protein